MFQAVQHDVGSFRKSSVQVIVNFTELCPEMNANNVYTLCDRHLEKSSPSPNLHLNASSSIEYELMWRLQVIVSYIKCLRSKISPFLGINGIVTSAVLPL